MDNDVFKVKDYPLPKLAGRYQFSVLLLNGPFELRSEFYQMTITHGAASAIISEGKVTLSTVTSAQDNSIILKNTRFLVVVSDGVLYAILQTKIADYVH